MFSSLLILRLVGSKHSLLTTEPLRRWSNVFGLFSLVSGFRNCWFRIMRLSLPQQNWWHGLTIKEQRKGNRPPISRKPIDWRRGLSRLWKELCQHGLRLGPIKISLLSYKVIFHHRISSHSRGKSPAELVFNRKIRIPIVSQFQQGQSVTYKPTPYSETSKAI